MIIKRKYTKFIYATFNQPRVFDCKTSRQCKLPYKYHFYNKLFTFIPDILKDECFTLDKVILN